MSDPAQKFKWWWRDLEKAKRGSKTLRRWLDSPLHERETRRAAWYYEAEKRLTGKYRFDNPFPKLTSQQMRDAVHIWGYDAGERDSKAALTISVHPAHEPSGNTGKWYRSNFSFNLESSNEALYGALVKHLEEVRAKRRIKLSRWGRNDEAWKQIEAHDLDKNLGDSERKQKSEMTKKYFEKTALCHLPDEMIESRQRYLSERKTRKR
jgi:hypothetical protein